MALVAHALTTVDRACAWMGIDTPATGSTQELRIQLAINSATDYIERYTGRRFKKTSYTQEEYDAEEGGVLLLKNYPISSNDSFSLQIRTSGVNEDSWEFIDGQYFHVDYENGIIKAAGSSRFNNSIMGYRASYTAGYDFNNSTTFLSDVGAGDLEMAVFLLVASLYTRGADGGGIMRERIGDYDVTYARTMMQTPELAAILDNYVGPSLSASNTPFQFG